MKYALLIYMGNGVFDQLPKDTQEVYVRQHRQLNALARSAGHYEGSIRLVGAEAATHVVTRGAEQLIMDGPYPETKEVLVGLYLVDCPSLNDAIGYAQRIPVAPLGGVEIRPIGYIEQP